MRRYAAPKVTIFWPSEGFMICFGARKPEFFTIKHGYVYTWATTKKVYVRDMYWNGI
jgi:hypothetical protein